MCVIYYSSTCPGTVASTLDTNKYKFLTKISLDCLEIVKSMYLLEFDFK